MVFTLVLASVIVFGLALLVPGDPAFTLAGESATPEQIEEVRRALGLDQPAHLQFLNWASRAIHGDLGKSLFSGQPVATEIARRLPVTLSVALLATAMATVLSIIVGLLASLRRGTWIDRTVTGVASVAMAMPEFWVGLLLVSLFALKLGWFPVAQYVPLSENPSQWLMHLVLPAMALGVTKTAELARQVRSSMSQVLEENYIRTARAKGLRSVQIIAKHALKNAGTAFVTVLGVRIAVLLGGVIVIERVFALPGLGSLMVNSVLARDLPMVQGVAIAIAVMVLIINFLVDLSYRFFNPRVRVIG
jgi:peptide/nickel transport system permease protein